MNLMCLILVTAINLPVWAMNVPCIAAERNSELAKVYSAKDELRVLGATHTLWTHDVEAFMKPIREMGYNAVMVHGLDDEWGATFESKFFPFRPQRNFKPDTLKRIIDACHAERVKVIVYAPYYMLTNNPEYVEVYLDDADESKDSEGAIKLKPGRRYSSMDTPFRDLLAGALKEIAALGADGLWIDGFTMEHNGRICGLTPHGLAAFERETGLKTPRRKDWKDKTFRRWVQWRYHHHIENGRWLAEQVRAAYPNVHLSFNTHFVTPSFSDPDRRSDSGPISWDRWREGVPLWRLPEEMGASSHARLMPSNGAQHTPLWASLQSDLNPLRSDIWQPSFAERFSIGYSHTWISPQMNIPGDEVAFRMSALGAFAFHTQLWIEGFIHRQANLPHPEIYTRLNQAIASREAYFGGEKLCQVGVVLSNNTRDNWGLAQYRSEDPRNTDRLFTESYLGLVSMLLADHIPYSHIFDNMLEGKILDSYPAIILPNVACLSETACTALRGYVERGGRLIATYESSLYDELGDIRKDFGLADVFGASYQSTLDRVVREPHVWVRELADPTLNGGDKGFTWQTRRTLVKPRDGVSLLAWETGVNQAMAPLTEFKFSVDPRQEPVIIENKVGKGEAVYIVDDLSQGYYQAPFRSEKRILRSLINRSPAPFSVDAPAQIIVSGYRQAESKRIVIHLLNLPPMSNRLIDRSQMDALDEIVPVHEIVVTLKQGSPRRARLIPANSYLELMQKSEGAWQVRVPVVREHEMVVFEMND